MYRLFDFVNNFNLIYIELGCFLYITLRITLCTLLHNDNDIVTDRIVEAKTSEKFLNALLLI